MDDRQPRKPGRVGGVAWIVAIVFTAAVIAAWLVGSGGQQHSYTQFLADVDAGQVSRVTIDSGHDTVAVVLDNGRTYETAFPDNTQQRLVDDLRSHHVTIDVEASGGSWIGSALLYLLPVALVIGFLLFVMRRMGAGGGASGILQMRRSRARELGGERPDVTFSDVAGADEAVEELQEIKEFLADPMRFRALGAQIPKGVLLLGPPGTGKTLLARAVAGEAGVPFFCTSGSDFVEMFVGVGASRVRDLFEKAKRQAPCIIFVDEIDAVGRQRGAGTGGGHDEREQTLNQILVEMDGFQRTDNVILIAATNRPDVLDPALLRPGRFDRQITVDRPDRAGREQILRVHARGKPLAAGVDLAAIAAQTPGFTGADLANLVNEGALLAARARRPHVSTRELQEALLRVVAGPERRTRVMTEHERLVTAYHEMGHALVGHVLEHSDPIQRVSIVSRGRALGLTISLPEEDTYLTTERQLADRMAMALGGRTAEQLVFGEVTSGAADDLDRVTDTAKQMVMRFGMGERLPPRTYGRDRAQPFLGRDVTSGDADYSDAVARTIDAEIRRVVEQAQATARRVLEERREQLDRAARTLVERETLEGEELAALLGPGGPNGHVPRGTELARVP